jgi:hypothetical protein
MTRWRTLLLTAASLALAATSGFLASRALGTSAQAARTVTINVATGPQGPPGPPGQAGLACPDGFSPADVVVNHPGGQTTLYVCVKD